MTSPDPYPATSIERRSKPRYLLLVLLLLAFLVGASAVTAITATALPPSSLGLQTEFVNAVKAVRPSVVEISTTTGLGSGVVLNAQGDIVTNAHVVGTAKAFSVSFSNGKTVPGRIVGSYAPDDLAVIRVTPEGWMKPATFGNSSSLVIGDFVLAMGNPLGLSSSVTDGIVSFNGRSVSEGGGVVLPDLIQTSAAINPGNSGGALVDLSDQVIGIPTLAASNGTTAYPGLGFAIPSNTVELIAPQLISKGKVTTAGRASLGVGGTDATNAAGDSLGVEVTYVKANGPAARAGIKVGELITSINGKSTPDYTAMQTVLAELDPGSKVSVSIIDKAGHKSSVTAVLSDLAAA